MNKPSTRGEHVALNATPYHNLLNPCLDFCSSNPLSVSNYSQQDDSFI